MEEAAQFAKWVTDKFSDNGRVDVKKKKKQNQKAGAIQVQTDILRGLKVKRMAYSLEVIAVSREDFAGLFLI